VTYLLDTNVISEVRKAQGNSQVKAWFEATPTDDLYLSVLTIGEIRRGIQRLRRRDIAQADVFDAWLAGLLREFGKRVLPVTTEIADVWGRLGVPDPVSTVDGLLAATADVGGLTLVTRNTADLARTGVPLLNPFDASN
jgi:predicted nucleic acid-binding protein